MIRSSFDILPAYGSYITVSDGKRISSGYFQGVGNAPKAPEDAIHKIENGMPVFFTGRHIWFIGQQRSIPLIDDSVRWAEVRP